MVVGLLQGVAISYEFITKRKRLEIASKLNPTLVLYSSRLITFLFFCLTLVFFNSNHINDSWYFLSHMFQDVQFQLRGNRLIFDSSGFLIAIFAFVIVIVTEAMQEKGIDVAGKFLRKPRLVRWAGYYIMIAFIFYFSGSGESFVYLQF